MIYALTDVINCHIEVTFLTHCNREWLLVETFLSQLFKVKLVPLLKLLFELIELLVPSSHVGILSLGISSS